LAKKENKEGIKFRIKMPEAFDITDFTFTLLDDTVTITEEGIEKSDILFGVDMIPEFNNTLYKIMDVYIKNKVFEKERQCDVCGKTPTTLDGEDEISLCKTCFNISKRSVILRNILEQFNEVFENNLGIIETETVGRLMKDATPFIFECESCGISVEVLPMESINLATTKCEICKGKGIKNCKLIRK
jgi:hypothetical protein